MKKLCHRVPVFLAFLLLLTIVAGVAATAHARACAHTFEFERGNEYLQYSQFTAQISLLHDKHMHKVWLC